MARRSVKATRAWCPICNSTVRLGAARRYTVHDHYSLSWFGRRRCDNSKTVASKENILKAARSEVDGCKNAVHYCNTHVETLTEQLQAAKTQLTEAVSELEAAETLLTELEKEP